MKKLIIEVALNEYVTRSEHPGVPLTPQEIAAQAKECADAGASVIHFHPRRPAGEALDSDLADDVDFYRETMKLIAERCDVITYPTYTSAVTETAADSTKKLFPHVRALRESGSPALETFVFFIGATALGRWDYEKGGWASDGVSTLSFELTNSFLKWCKDSGLKPQFGVREIGHLRQIAAFREAGLIDGPVVLHLNVSNSEPFGPPPTAAGLASLLQYAAPDWEAEWFIHNWQNRFNSTPSQPERHRLLNVLAICMDGHARTGVGALPRWGDAYISNAEMVRQLVSVADTIGRKIATPADARRLLGLG